MRLRIPKPGAWPVRWRLAAASAALTLVILVAFAAVVGRLVTTQVREDFDDELRGAASSLATETAVGRDPVLGEPVVSSPRLDDFARANAAAIRIVDERGQLLAASSNSRQQLGPPSPDVRDAGDLRVATAAIRNSGPAPTFVQYARDPHYMNATVDRVWLFLLAGILGGTVLATFAGLAVADRAMRPIASLTEKAREIATTRDTSQRMPPPSTDDEVGELAWTLGEMLRSIDASRSERERALERQREFVADASHELRTPLTSVLANLELLHASLGDDSEDNETVTSALASSRRMSRLVGDLLLLARADAGRVGPRRACDLSEIAVAAAAEVEPVADGHRIELTENGPASLEGDPDELHRLVLNLLDNAARHAPPGSAVDLRVGAGDGEATLEVIDDGPGIPAGMEDQIFERFVRGTGPADTAPGSGTGTGLGLAIVRAVAEAHGGSVEAGREVGRGAKFTVRLPPSERAPLPTV